MKKGKTIDTFNLHGQIDRYIHEYENYIEDWKDQARIIMRFIKEEGGLPLTAKPPAPMHIDDDTFYLYRIKFKDLDGKEKWLAFESETGIAEVLNNEPNPASFS